MFSVSRGTVVGIAITLRAGQSGDRIPVGVKFSATLQTGPGAHPASYTIGIVSFAGVKRPGRGLNHPPLSSAEVKERVELYLPTPPGAFMTCSRANFTFRCFFGSSYEYVCITLFK